MSIINDALKKAQHQRTGPATDQPPMPGTPQGFRAARLTQQNQGMPKQTVMLIVAGIGGVVAVAVVITILVLRHEPATQTLPPARIAAAKPITPEIISTPSPVIVAPVAAPPPKIEVVAPKPLVTEPVKVAVAEPAKSTPVVTAPPAAAPAPVQEAPRAVASGTQDIRILTLLDSFRVTGIRSSGTESKVLMNDRVYRINDMVDYTLGIRLTKVATDNLTFVDANGTVYVKNF